MRGRIGFIFIFSLVLVLPLSFAEFFWNNNKVTGEVIDSSFTLTDEFDFWEDQSSHDYRVAGATLSGAYSCSGESFCTIPNCGDSSLRLGNGGNGGGEVSIEMDVTQGTDEIILGLNSAWCNGNGGNVFDLIIDGVDFSSSINWDELNLCTSQCQEKEIPLSGLSDYTEDGKINIEISDAHPETLGGDSQLTYLKVYSKEVSSGGGGGGSSEPTQSLSCIKSEENLEINGLKEDDFFGIIEEGRNPKLRTYQIIDLFNSSWDSTKHRAKFIDVTSGTKYEGTTYETLFQQATSSAKGTVIIDGRNYDISFTFNEFGDIIATIKKNWCVYPETTQTCIDSDGGKNVLVSGEAEIEGGMGQGDWCDYSKGENKIYEAYCTNGTISIELINCPSDQPYCNKGKCSSIKPLCTENDGGKNPSVVGTTFPSRIADHTGSTDYCQKTSTGQPEEKCSGSDCSLREFFCADGAPDESYENIPCPSGCSKGVCVSENSTTTQKCSALINQMKNPPEYLKIYGDVWESNWNSSSKTSWYINGKEETGMDYYNTWYLYDEDKRNNYFSQAITVFDNKKIDLSGHLKERFSLGVCQIDSYWAGDKENAIYVCNWDALNKKQNSNKYQSNIRQIIWTNENVLIHVNSEVGSQLSDEEIKEIAKIRVDEFLDDLEDNKFEYVGWESYSIPYPSSDFLYNTLNMCSSELKADDLCKTGYWECKTEPVICPPHGEQKTTCVRWNSCEDNRREEEIKESIDYCSPGQCSGCYTPKWLDFSATSQNKCIPYGFRFEQEINAGKGERTRGVTDIITEGEFVDDHDEVDFRVISPTEAYLRVEEWDNITHLLEVGKELKIDGSQISEEEIISIKLTISEIIYFEDGSPDNYAEISFVMSELGRITDSLNMYCDIDGQSKVQKTIDSNSGDWAKCQNDYECKSNVCSSGECIEVASIIKETKGFKNLGVRILCRLAHLFSEENYDYCVENFLK